MQNEKKELEQKALIKKEETLRNYVVFADWKTSQDIQRI